MKSSSNITASLSVLAALLLATAGIAGAESADPHPLAPPDRSSPRATLHTLLDSIDKAWALYNVGDPSFQRPFVVAQRSVDVSRLPPKEAPRLAGEVVLMFKEILDRIELPPDDQIPGSSDVEAKSLTAWTIPNTEIVLSRPSEGDQADQFLISPATIDRIEEFYNRVRHLPYRPGKKGAHYDELRFGTKSRLFGAVVARLPQWTKREASGQLLWQWIGLAIMVVASVMLALAAFRFSFKHTLPVRESQGWNRIWAFVFPVTLMFLALLVRILSEQHLRIWGGAGAHVRLFCAAIGMFGGAWATVVLVTRGAEHVIKAADVERPLTQQLIRVSSRAGALVLILLWVFFGGQRLGLPVSALLAGLGVGGFAVALAAQGTIENLIGGISLYADQPVRVGDSMKLGNRIGTLEEIGLRSAKVRTREKTIITVPNAEFARLQLENLSRRTEWFLLSSLRLGPKASSDSLRRLLARLTDLLKSRPEMLEDSVQANLVGIGADFIEVEIRALVGTTVYTEFVAIREEILLQAIGLVEEEGLALAIPPRVHYLEKGSITGPPTEPPDPA